MDHGELLIQLTARIDRLEDRVIDKLDVIEDNVAGQGERVSKLETSQGWLIKLGTALIVGAWTAIISLYKTI